MRIIHALSALVVVAMTTCAFRAANAQAETVERHVTLGGVRGFSSLANPSATAALRRSQQVGLYLHAEAWKPLDPNLQKQILQVFENTGPAVVELGFNSTPGGYFKNFYKVSFVDRGVSAETALINGLWSAKQDQARAFIDTAKSYGLKRVAPVFSPNSGQYKTSGFNAARWNDLRQTALYGGALSIDAPPHVFIALGQSYQRFVMDEILWARSQHIPVYSIISANASKDHFFEETRSMLDLMRRNHATPDRFVLETYDPHFTDPANTVGSETENGTLLNVALELLRRHWIGL